MRLGIAAQEKEGGERVTGFLQINGEGRSLRKGNEFVDEKDPCDLRHGEGGEKRHQAWGKGGVQKKDDVSLQKVRLLKKKGDCLQRELT